MNGVFLYTISVQHMSLIVQLILLSLPTLVEGHTNIRTKVSDCVVLSGSRSDVSSRLVAPVCCSARIFNVSLNAGPANYSNARRAKEKPCYTIICAQEQVLFFRGVFLETVTAHKT